MTWMTTLPWRIFVTGLLVGGVVLFLHAAYYTAKGKPYPARRDPRMLVVIALVVGSLGVLAQQVTTRFAAVPTAPTDASDARFDSAGPPALSIDAPPGWVVRHDAAKRTVTLLLGGATPETARAILSFETSVLTKEVDTAALAGDVVATLRARGLSVADAPTPDPIVKASAHLVVARAAEAEICTWIVQRDTHLATTMQCVARGSQRCREACKPALARLQWRTPVGIAPSDR